MHILALEEYGLRCLLQVAGRDAEGPVSAQEISRAEGIGPAYVARILATLRAGGLVESTRGAGGGSRLARPARDISVWEAISVLGGEFFPEGFCDCHPGQRRECIHASDCSIRALWQKIEGVLRDALDSISLEDLRRDERSMVTWLDLEALSPPASAGEPRS